MLAHSILSSLGLVTTLSLIQIFRATRRSFETFGITDENRLNDTPPHAYQNLRIYPEIHHYCEYIFLELFIHFIRMHENYIFFVTVRLEQLHSDQLYMKFSQSGP